VTEPLSPEEQREMSEHLAFFRQFKPYLGLSLNATEDLLVNGVRPPTDRGVCKHLLSKLDRRAIERALGREAVKTSPGLRARLLAGAVRISPDVGNLLAYLEALTWVADKHEAAAAFGATIDRIDFGTVSASQMAGTLDVIEKTFEGQERIQALFGLLENETFRRALDRTLSSLPEPLRAEFAPLSAAHRAVMRGELPRDASERFLAEQGVATWLGAPDRVLRSYPGPVRRRLLQYALGDVDLSRIAKPIRILVDALPREDPASANLALALFDRFMAARQDDLARGLLNALLQAQPNLRRAKQRQEILGWPRKGRLAIPPGGPKPERLRRVFSFDLPGFVWARFGTLQDGVRLEGEAELQASLLVPGVASCLGYGTGPDATPYVVIAPGSPGARQLHMGAIRALPLREALSMAAEGIKILVGLAFAGVDMPDASALRFANERAPSSLRLLDMDGARQRPQEACRAHAAELAVAFCRELLGAEGRGSLRRDTPRAIADLLVRGAPPAELVRTLAVCVAREWDGNAEVAEPSPSRPAKPAGPAAKPSPSVPAAALPSSEPAEDSSSSEPAADSPEAVPQTPADHDL
jgi:hypothetical protein